MALIVFEDEHLLVVNKPAGWNTHAPGPFSGEGLYEWLKNREPRWATLAIIHRLDKETSGLLVFGKTSEANRSLTAQFTTRDVIKTYIMLTDRHVPFASIVASSTIVRSGERYLSRPMSAGGAHAETHFRLEGKQANGSSIVEVVPVTGRTHQIRVHAAEHGFPILGDQLYAGTPAARVFLHAGRLTMRHPASGEPMTFESAHGWNLETPVSEETGRVEARLSLREAAVDAAASDAYRLVHGASDGWAGFYVDKLGDFLLAETEDSLGPHELGRLQSLARTVGCRGIYHKKLNRNVRGATSSESSPQLVSGDKAADRFAIRENGLTFELSFSEGYSVGLFLDQRDNRRRWMVNHVAAGFTLFEGGIGGRQFLNTFAYTCGFSLAAARAGAITTSLDLSKKYLDWGKQNFLLNGIDPEQHRFIYGDAFDWMRRLAKKQRAFDGIVLDPPTFSHSKDRGVWQAEKHYQLLITTALPLLKAGGVLLACTNASRIDPEEFVTTVKAAVGPSKRKVIQEHFCTQPPDFPVTREEPAHLKTVWLRIG
jgi:23S rRNA (cytosine1962-C5)-methyltransferase